MAVQLPRFLQTKTYSAQRVRAMLADQGGGIQNGVVNAGDLLVSQKAGGANMSVDVAAGAAWVFGTTVARQGAYNAYNDAVVNLSIAANSSGNPRLDQIILRIYDTIDGGAGSDQATVEVLQGAATAGATLANRAGAAALPASSILLGDVLVGNGAGSITNSVIRDRRPWARGAFWSNIRTAGGNLTYAGASAAAIDSTNWSPRLECSGAPVRVRFSADIGLNVIGQVAISLSVDGALGIDRDVRIDGNSDTTPGPEWLFTSLAAGSHTFQLQWRITQGSATAMIYQSQVNPYMLIEELVRQNTANNPAGYG